MWIQDRGPTICVYNRFQMRCCSGFRNALLFSSFVTTPAVPTNRWEFVICSIHSYQYHFVALSSLGMSSIIISHASHRCNRFYSSLIVRHVRPQAPFHTVTFYLIPIGMLPVSSFSCWLNSNEILGTARLSMHAYQTKEYRNTIRYSDTKVRKL